MSEKFKSIAFSLFPFKFDKNRPGHKFYGENFTSIRLYVTEKRLKKMSDA